MALGALSLKGRALRHLARREHSRAELERKLVARAEDTPEASAAEQVRAVLDDLAARGLLSDVRAAESVLAVAGRRLGSRRIAWALQAKGLAPGLVEDALAKARATEFERAWALWQRRYGAAPADRAGQARQSRFLAGRGFDGDVIRRVLRRAGGRMDGD
ncbi:MAG: recombination regulator RecX [Proteobacteria bacterium]|mgnify:FL=1|jgi:regulatory protein|nr:recombination regulator RecX [Pseudomonadota bacterium]HOL38444.1 recombination regulator RecX [Rubrivivax sp.]